MTREEADKVVCDMVATVLPFQVTGVEEYWVTSRGLRVRYQQPAGFGRQVFVSEMTLPMPRAEAQALVDAGGE